MSMASLSTELDTRIASFLGTDTYTLDKLSRVSKYYREITVPILYKDLWFWQGQKDCILCLLRTMVEQPELELHIHSFQLGYRKEMLPRSDRKTSGNNEWIWKNAGRIIVLINRLGGHILPPEMLLRWTAGLFKPPLSLDAALATVLTMATNLEYIQLYHTQMLLLQMTSSLIEWQWLPTHNGDGSFPFWKLKHLCIRSNWVSSWQLPQTAVLPSLEVIKVRNYQRGEHFVDKAPLKFPYPLTTTCRLRELDFRGVAVMPTQFERLLRSPWLQNVQRLVVVGRGGADIHWNGYEFNRISEAICSNLHNVECIYWCGPDYSRGLRPFGSFKSLMKLHILQVGQGIIRLPRNDTNTDGILLIRVNIYRRGYAVSPFWISMSWN
ncbi:hypothetical protein BDV96DRAFT_652493 [Lophiotrema nucula]|uniref:F-box domain-containing protein n=1 Tax=Lophiotrema nucula TaxID=690887 RepID=A0A6A5YS26_9PLEO|nr:hypothetical protein BDV96DRAFT_652493 [Lophiotrema nucula]